MRKIDEVIFEHVKRLHESSAVSLFQEMGRVAQRVDIPDQTILPGVEFNNVGGDAESIKKIVRSMQPHEIAFEELTTLYQSIPTSILQPIVQIAQEIVPAKKTTLSRLELENIGVDNDSLQDILRVLQEISIIAEQDDQTQVQNLDFFSYALAQQVFSDESLLTFSDQQIIERILSFEGELQGNPHTSITCLLILLINPRKSTSFLNSLLNSANSNFIVLGCLSNALPMIELETNEYLQLAQNLERVFGQDMSRTKLFQGLKHTGKRKPQYTWKLIEQIQNAIEIRWNYLPNLIAGLAQNQSEYKRCYKTVIQWIESQNRYLIRAGLYCLKEVSKHHENESIAVLEEHSYSPDYEIRGDVVLSLVYLFKHNEAKCLNILKRLAQDKNENVRYVVADRLSRAKDNIPTNHQMEIAELYSVENPQYRGILQSIGSVLAHLGNEYPKRVLSFFKQWMLQHKSIEELILPNSDFHYPLSELFSKQLRVSVQVMCDWLIKESWIVKDAAMRLMVEFSGPPLNQAAPFRNNEFPSVFSEITASIQPTETARIISVLSKLDVYPHNLSLLAFIGFDEDNSCCKAMEAALIRLASDYPIQVKSELERNWMNNDAARQKIAQRVIEQIDHDLSHHKKNTIPLELYADQSVTELYFKHWNERVREISKQISPLFPTLHMMPKTQFNRGNKIYIEHPDGNLEEEDFSENRNEISFPKTWVLDPDIYEYRKWVLLAKNIEQENDK